MKVTLVIAALSAGGAERVISTMANFWARRGWPITIVSFDDCKTVPFFELAQSVRHSPLGLLQDSAGLIAGIWNNIRRIMRLRRTLACTNSDAIISFGEKTNVTTLIATWGMPTRVIVSERTDPHMHVIGRIWSALRWCVYARADRIVVQSAGAREYFLPKFRRTLTIIPNPVPAVSNVQLVPEDHSTRRVILGVGRLSAEKGFENLLSAFAQIRPQYPDWTMTIIGEGPQRPALEALRETLGLSNSVSLPGLDPTLWDRSSSVGLFVLCSHFEGFPNALCEAMAHGIPVIATDCPSGPREIIEHGKNGLLVPPADVQALADAMASLLSDPARRTHMGHCATDITQRFGLEKVMRMWEDVLPRTRD